MPVRQWRPARFASFQFRRLPAPVVPGLNVRIVPATVLGDRDRWATAADDSRLFPGQRAVCVELVRGVVDAVIAGHRAAGYTASSAYSKVLASMIPRATALLLTLMLPVQGMAIPHPPGAEERARTVVRTARLRLDAGLRQPVQRPEYDCPFRLAAGECERPTPCDSPSQDGSVVRVGSEVELTLAGRIELRKEDSVVRDAGRLVRPLRGELCLLTRLDRPPDSRGGCRLDPGVLALRI